MRSGEQETKKLEKHKLFRQSFYFFFVSTVLCHATYLLVITLELYRLRFLGIRMPGNHKCRQKQKQQQQRLNRVIWNERRRAKRERVKERAEMLFVKYYEEVWMECTKNKMFLFGWCLTHIQYISWASNIYTISHIFFALCHSIIFGVWIGDKRTLIHYSKVKRQQENETKAREEEEAPRWGETKRPKEQREFVKKLWEEIHTFSLV